MEKNDISGEVVPRLLIEFEGLVAYPPTEEKKRFFFSRKPSAKQTVDLWEFDELVVKVICDRAWRLHQQIDVITTYPTEFAEALNARFENEEIPVRNTWTFEPNRLARKLDFMPHVAAVYTPDPRRVLLYGGKGRHVVPDNISQIGLF